MAMTTVMVLFDGSAQGRCTLRSAFLAARRDGGHVLALYPVPPSERVTPEVMSRSRTYLGHPGGDVLAVLERSEREGGAGAEAAHRLFEEVVSEVGASIQERPPNPGTLSAFFRVLSPGDPDTVAARARVFDLVVIQQPHDDPGHRVRKLLRAILFHAGRPVLVAPPSDPSSLGKRPLIAWDGSARSARAAAIARNFFEDAREVGILSVRGKQGAGPSAQDLADALAWHDIEPTVIEADMDSLRLGDVFLREAARFEADLLVMGAYAQSAFRESLTGGVTNHVLSHAELPVLMTH